MKQYVIATVLLVVCGEVALHKAIKVEKDAPSDSSVGEDTYLLPPDENIFIHEIFDKYGSEGIISFEGFEHLLENLGLGRLEFEKSHSVYAHHVNGTFKEVHDVLDLHRHHHVTTSATPTDEQRRRRSLTRNNHSTVAPEDSAPEEDPGVHVAHKSYPLKRCLSPQEILQTFGLEAHHSVAINTQKFLVLCPAIVYELDQRSCYHYESFSSEAKPSQATHFSAWLYASLSVLVISLVGLLGVAVVPLVNKTYFKQCLNFLVALAVGTLCGDALLHLLPHALMSGDGPNSHTTSVLRATVAFLSMTFFFFIEAIIRSITTAKESKKSFSKDDGAIREHIAVELVPIMTESSSTPSHGHQHGEPSHGHQHFDGDGQVSSVAWMVIMGDGLHNLTDGLAIGAAFAGDTVAGVATTMAVFCHELPHEIGDFAVLLNSGMSVRRALCYNVFSSVLSFTGMALGVWIGDHDEAALWIYAATAGTFLYISLADLIPEMNSTAAGPKTPVDILLQVAGIMVGGGIMLAIALYEDDLRSMFN